jgi:signal transduction histidine kinase
VARWIHEVDAAATAPTIRLVAMDFAVPRADRRLRRARVVALVWLATGVWTSLVMPGIGLLRESSLLWIGLGAAGILAFAAAHSGALYAAMTPWLTEAARRRLLASFVAVAVLSVPLVGPVGADRWATWAWLGASIIGTAPLLGHRWAGVLATVAALAAAASVAWWTGGSVAAYLLIAGSVGAMVAAVNWLQVWFWDLLVQARQGQAAQARLAATEERLRFARDVHDLLGHNLSIIALKAELAARLAPVDAERAGQEAAEVQRLAAAALTDIREAVHGYRAVDLLEQLTATEHVLRSCGVRCTIVPPTGDLPAEVATQLAAVLREASTNVLRHSRASWCRIDIGQDGDQVRMTVTNDGATGTGPDRNSYGLRGLAERLTAADGAIRTRNEDGVFTLEATLPAAS